VPLYALGVPVLRTLAFLTGLTAILVILARILGLL
jgi:uncharacterized MAPEG superfamily protein